MEEENRHIELLDRFMIGKTSPEEEMALLDWFRSPHSREELLSFYQGRWDETSDHELPAEIQGRMFHHIKARMKEREEVDIKQLTQRYRILRWWSNVAVILLCIGLGVGSYVYFQKPAMTYPKEYIVSAEKGQRASLTLPDGTKVWLNSHTYITYDTDYGYKERAVSLSGEAYFEVAKDTERRFVVKAGELEVEALGTTFNVKAYEEDTESTATLFEGSIRAVAGNKIAVLSPSQQVCFNKENKSFRVKHSANSFYARMWRNNELAFERETLEDIALLMNRMYNVQIHFKSEKIKHYRFSGVIRNNSLGNVFKIISLTAPITYQSVGDTIYLDDR